MIEWLWSPEKFLPESKFWKVAIPTAIGTAFGSWFFWSSLISAGRYVWAMLWGEEEENGTEVEEKKPHEEEFTEAMIDGVRWQWSWEDGKPSSPTPLCPECGIKMDFQDAYAPNVYPPKASVRCPKGCETVNEWEGWSKEGLRDLIEREVKRCIREDEWQSNSETPHLQLFSS